MKEGDYLALDRSGATEQGLIEGRMKTGDPALEWARWSQFLRSPWFRISHYDVAELGNKNRSVLVRYARVTIL